MSTALWQGWSQELDLPDDGEGFAFDLLQTASQASAKPAGQTHRINAQ